LRISKIELFCAKNHTISSYKYMRHLFNKLLVTILLFIAFGANGQNTIEGKVVDKSSGLSIIGATVVIEGTTNGTLTDIDGKFNFETEAELPLVLLVHFMGYEQVSKTMDSWGQKLKIQMKSSDVMLKAVEVVDNRITEQQQKSPLTVETMDVTAIKEAPSGNFYESLGTLKGVDMTSASLGFKVINTRGFNSTSPVRSLQVIDGVDNQSPGLNFSLGNFLGASDLDVKRVNIVAGASSAYYGPGAFNGVIAIETKDPFLFPGLSVELKAGERNMYQAAVRWAQVIKNKEGFERFGYKLNFFYFQARDWEAENYSPTDESEDGVENPGGYDAVNIYGDEDVYLNNDYTDALGQFESPGLGRYYRTGYREIDLADYNTNNVKTNVSLYYNITKKLQLEYAFNYGTGTTIYQGDNRFSLKNIQFYQNKLELRQQDKFFVRFYATNEDAGDSYDIYSTALEMQEIVNTGEQWNIDYKRNWNIFHRRNVRNLEGYPTVFFPLDEWAVEHEAFIATQQDSLIRWHQENRAYTDSTSGRGNLSRFDPGTAAFDSVFTQVRTAPNSQGGSRFIDRSALYHAHAEYRLKPEWGELVLGGNGRLYQPYSEGTIFEDTISYNYANRDSGRVITDSSFAEISNYEYGVYVGGSVNLVEDKLILNGTLRMDKNENFDYLFSPAISAVYTPIEKHTFRISFSSAIRNPTLADQYLFLDVGRAVLKGNLNGYDSLVTVESFNEYRNTLNVDTLDYFNVAPVVPEKVRTIEVGYRGTFNDRIYLDLNAYHSWYDDFIGYNLGIDLQYDPVTRFPVSVQAYRLASNALSQVTTVGACIGLNYYFDNKYMIYGNYSWNKLSVQDENDPLIPAFNTPENKFNIGLTGREITLPLIDKTGFGFGINYKWVQGFIFEGSPQFTGAIDSYGVLDAQINYQVKKIFTTFKLGASNVLDNRVYQVYGGPRVGRLAYFSILFDWNLK
jgi:iron complex outermembrane receptor protein